MKKKLKKLAVKEALNLYKYTTYEEKKELAFGFVTGSIDPDIGTHCIYGWLTGSCNGNRAIELMGKCTEKFVNNLTDDVKVTDSGINERETYYKNSVWSPIESYACKDYANVEALVKMIVTGLDKDEL
jgi:hypothetical protein